MKLRFIHSTASCLYDADCCDELIAVEITSVESLSAEVINFNVTEYRSVAAFYQP